MERLGQLMKRQDQVMERQGLENRELMERQSLEQRTFMERQLSLMEWQARTLGAVVVQLAFQCDFVCWLVSNLSRPSDSGMKH